ncbi:MAG: DUF5788 family protein [Halobacteriaceae archaeon]
MNERQREELIAQIHRGSGTVGRSIPETVTIEGETVPLREFYFDVSDRDDLQEDDRERIGEMLSYLRRKRRELVLQIRRSEVDYETGESLVSEIRDLDRAINALESLEEPDLEEQLRQEKIQSARELVDIMRKFGKS